MPTAINSVECKKFVKGTGLVSCEPFFGQPTSIFLTAPGWSLPTATTASFDKEYIVQQIQGGVFIPFLNTVSFTENTPDPTRQEYTGGKRRTIRNGNPDYMFEFDNGVGFHTAAYSYNGGKFGAILFDEVGNAQLIASIDLATLYAIGLSDVNTRTYRQQSGDTASATMLEVQVESPEVFNRQMVIIPVEQIGVNVNNEVFGVVSVKINIVTASVANGIVVDVTAANNPKFGIRNLVMGSFQVANLTDDVTSSVSAAVESTSVPGRYTLTVTATPPGAGDSIQVMTYQYNADQSVRIPQTNQLYRGISPETMVA